MKTYYTLWETSTVPDQNLNPESRLSPHLESKGLLRDVTSLSGLKQLRQHSSTRSILLLVNKNLKPYGYVTCIPDKERLLFEFLKT